MKKIGMCQICGGSFSVTETMITNGMEVCMTCDEFLEPLAEDEEEEDMLEVPDNYEGLVSFNRATDRKIAP